MLFALWKTGKTKKSYSLVQQARKRVQNAKSKLLQILNEQIEWLQNLDESSKTKYSEKDLAKMLLAVGNYRQYLKLNPSKVGKLERALLQYLASGDPQKPSFSNICSKLYKELAELDVTSPMVSVKHNELLNTYVYLLVRIDACRG